MPSFLCVLGDAENDLVGRDAGDRTLNCRRRLMRMLERGGAYSMKFDDMATVSVARSADTRNFHGDFELKASMTARIKTPKILC